MEKSVNEIGNGFISNFVFVSGTVLIFMSSDEMREMAEEQSKENLEVVLKIIQKITV